MSRRAERLKYVRVGDRDVHLRVVGDGPPLLALHASPGSSSSLRPLAQALDGWQVLALDTPGCGRSDPLANANPTIDDYAAATLAALDYLGVERCALFGTHTGAKIALALAHLAPKRFSGLILDGLGISTRQEQQEQLENYTPRHTVKADGSHIVSVWHQVRDMALFWPWYAQDSNHRLKITPPSAESMHDMVVDMLRNLEHYGLTYHAAFRHDPMPRLASAPVPTLVRAAADDPLCTHLSRIENASAQVTVDGLADTDSSVRILEWLRELHAIARWHPRAVATPKAGCWKTYLGSGDSVIHTIVHSPPAARARPLVALHASPASGQSLQSLARPLSDERVILLPDLPGLGDSRPPPGAEPDIEDIADVLGSAVAGFIGERADVYGTHSGAAVALEWAQQGAFPAAHVLLDGLLLDIPEKARNELLARYATPLVPDIHGLHMLEAWHRVRDMLLFWPWYRQAADSVRSAGPDPSPKLIHDLSVQLLTANLTYPLVYRAAFRYHAEAKLDSVSVPTTLSAQPGDPLAPAIRQSASASRLLQLRPVALQAGLDDVVRLLRQAGG